MIINMAVFWGDVGTTTDLRTVESMKDWKIEMDVVSIQAHERGEDAFITSYTPKGELLAAMRVPCKPEVEVEEPSQCAECSSKNFVHLEGTTWECHDCGNTFEMTKPTITIEIDGGATIEARPKLDWLVVSYTGRYKAVLAGGRARFDYVLSGPHSRDEAKRREAEFNGDAKRWRR